MLRIKKRGIYACTYMLIQVNMIRNGGCSVNIKAVIIVPCSYSLQGVLDDSV